MEKIRKKIISLLLAIFLLTGCGKLEEGEICEKAYLPESTVVSLIPMTICNGKTITTILVPYTFHYPDRWRIKIKSLNPNSEGEYETAYYYVTKETYDDCEIGGMFQHDKNRDFKEEPVTKERN